MVGEKKKARTTKDYHISNELFTALQTIVNADGAKHGVGTVGELIRDILGDFVKFYQKDTMFKATLNTFNKAQEYKTKGEPNKEGGDGQVKKRKANPMFTI